MVIDGIQNILEKVPLGGDLFPNIPNPLRKSTIPNVVDLRKGFGILGNKSPPKGTFFLIFQILYVNQQYLMLLNGLIK